MVVDENMFVATAYELGGVKKISWWDDGAGKLEKISHDTPKYTQVPAACYCTSVSSAYAAYYGV